MQKDIWEREYKKQRLVTMSNEPQSSVKDFLRWVRKGDAAGKTELSNNTRRAGLPLESLHVLDLGCGNGKNSMYIADLDSSNQVVGIDISPTALTYAREHTTGASSQLTYIEQSIGETLPFPDQTFDIVLDVTSSNSLSEKERATMLSEVHRVLKPDGYFFVRALCKDADKNAQYLLKNNPGPEKDTYIMPELGLTERVFSREDFIATYTGIGIDTGTNLSTGNFNLLHLEKETHYSKVTDRLYKRHFWVAYLQKV